MDNLNIHRRKSLRDIDSRLNLAATLAKMAGVKLKQGHTEEAQQTYRSALELSETFANPPSGSVGSRYTAGDIYSGLGRVAAASTGCADAQLWYRRSLEMWGRVNNPGLVSPNNFDTEGPVPVRAELARVVPSQRRII